MSRPLYEEDKDIIRQDIVADFVASRTPNCTLKITKKLSANDYIMINKATDAHVGFMEVKVRFASYPTLMFSTKKWYANLELSNKLNTPAFLVIAWPVRKSWEVIITKIDSIEKLGYKTGFGGRTDRNDPLDMEPVVYIPREAFSLVGTLSDKEAKSIMKHK